jgi:hypothetical protein
MMRRIVAATILLLAVHTYVSAQVRDDEMSLQGVKGVHLDVSWTARRVDAQSNARLKKLAGQAEAKLREAAIPLLRHTGEMEPAGNPRLTLRIKLNDLESSAAPILIESKFSQKVRLSRDPSKEMEVVTWENYGVGGPEITDDMMSRVLDSLLDMFIKAYRSVNPQQAVKK